MRYLPAMIVVAFVCLFWQQGHAEDRSQYFKGLQLNPEAKERLAYPYKSCCDNGDVVHTKFRVNKVNGDDQWQYEWQGQWKVVPADIIKSERSPYGALLFVSIYDKQTPVCFVPPDGGI